MSLRQVDARLNDGSRVKQLFPLSLTVSGSFPFGAEQLRMNKCGKGELTQTWHVGLNVSRPFECAISAVLEPKTTLLMSFASIPVYEGLSLSKIPTSCAYSNRTWSARTRPPKIEGKGEVAQVFVRNAP